MCYLVSLNEKLRWNKRNNLILQCVNAWNFRVLCLNAWITIFGGPNEQIGSKKLFLIRSSGAFWIETKYLKNSSNSHIFPILHSIKVSSSCIISILPWVLAFKFIKVIEISLPTYMRGESLQESRIPWSGIFRNLQESSESLGIFRIFENLIESCRTPNNSGESCRILVIFRVFC